MPRPVGTGAQPGAGNRPPPSKGNAGSQPIRRRPGTSRAESTNTPSRAAQESSSGILRFYTDDAPGFKIGPTTVLVCSVMFIGLVVILHIWGKFTST
mmetsp:Transcript_3006/g.3176  ORF Transcript_3006/g.3176 Transcript_3006/m.3176 type:complete len:97 (-) Transcript_3006:62-352(-)